LCSKGNQKNENAVMYALDGGKPKHDTSPRGLVPLTINVGNQGAANLKSASNAGVKMGEKG